MEKGRTEKASGGGSLVGAEKRTDHEDEDEDDHENRIGKEHDEDENPEDPANDPG
jgi:hypothetical protein